ncbi:MAG: hypothetical protein R3A79_26505 [Nannocystaceae bacterium]
MSPAGSLLDSLRARLGARSSRARPLGMLLVLAVGILFAGLFSPFITDDALITLRYARHLSAGEGIVFNPGEAPVEGYSNFLQLLLGALALRLDLAPLPLLRGLNLGAAILLLPALYTLVQRELGRPALATGAALLLAVHAPLWYWAASGLETALYALMLLAGVGLVSAARPGLRLLSALPLLLAALLRPEGAAAIAAIGCVLAVDALREAPSPRAGLRDLVRARGAWLAAVALPYAAYTAWRLATFGDLLPNTVHYKAGATSPGALVWALVDGAGPLVAAAALAPLHRLGPFARIAAALALLHAAMLWNVTPSVAYLHRFFIPVLPLLVALAAFAADAALGPRSRASARRGAVLLALAVAWSVLNPRSGAAAALERVDHHRQRYAARLRVAAALGERLDPAARIAVGDVGVIGYVLPNPIVDAFGLNDRAFTGRFARHRKRWVDAILRARPDAVVLVSKSVHEQRGPYRTDDHFAEHPIFRQDYLFDQAIAGPQGYHYRIYLHRRPRHRRAAPLALPAIRGDDLGRDTERLRLALAPGPAALAD